MNKHFFRLEDSLGYAIARAARTLKFGLRRAVQAVGFDVTPEQWGILSALWEREGRSQSELAEITLKDTANITRMIDVMENKGLVFREKDPLDRRTYKIFLTKQGQELQNRLVPVVQSFTERALSCLGRAERDDLMRMMNKLYAHASGLALKP